MKSRQAWLLEPGHFEIRTVDVTPCSTGLLIKARMCGLCNWELNHWKGIIGPYPQPLGHEVAGTVVGFGDDVPEGKFKIGDKVTCFAGGCFADYIVANYDSCFHLSDDVSVDEALGEPLSCVTNTVRRTKAEAGDVGVVVGCGPMGLWCIQALSGGFLGSLIAIDVDDYKLGFANKFGATHTINAQNSNAAELVNEISNGHMADFVIEGTGRPQTLSECVDYLRVGRGRLVIMSSHEESGGAFDWRPAMSKNAEILIAHPSDGVSMTENLRRAVSLLNNGVFNSSEIISHRFDLEEIEESFKALEKKPVDYIKGIVDFGA